MLCYNRYVTKSGKKQKYWGYHVLGTVRKRSVQISLTATNAGGYEVLDIVFEDAKEVPLYRSPFVMKDNDGKVTMSGYRYIKFRKRNRDGNQGELKASPRCTE